MLESDIVAHCAPTLAGIKTANMFNYLPDDMEKLHQEIQEENCKLNSKGVYVEILRTGEKRALIYVYRKNRLEADLNRKGAESILQTCGYECGEKLVRYKIGGKPCLFQVRSNRNCVGSVLKNAVKRQNWQVLWRFAAL